ncbi:hypothetical protein SDC9_189415 [bioreactor metagenome]|uniref:Uncharacterized protein n=1 Tax=bioreactor metagenome TaxID=1076179 RepID=A0A645HSN5_9ZZZZ
MRGEYDLVPHLFDVAVALFAQKFEREEAGVPLVEMEGRNIAVTHVAQQAQTADAEYQLLAEAVFVVAAV